MSFYTHECDHIHVEYDTKLKFIKCNLDCNGPEGIRMYQETIIKVMYTPNGIVIKKLYESDNFEDSGENIEYYPFETCLELAE